MSTTMTIAMPRSYVHQYEIEEPVAEYPQLVHLNKGTKTLKRGLTIHGQNGKIRTNGSCRVTLISAGTSYECAVWEISGDFRFIYSSDGTSQHSWLDRLAAKAAGFI